MADSDIRVKLTLTGTQAFSKNLAAVTKSTKAFATSLRNTSDAAVNFGRNIARIGAVAAAGLGAAATRFGAFEKDFTGVVTLLDDTSFESLPLEKGIDQLREGVIALRSESGESFANLNDGLFNLISAGVPAAQAIDSLRVATQLALAGVTDTAVAVDGITTALGAFGAEAGDATDISEKFFAAQKAGKTTIEELSSSVGLVAATAKAAGVNFDELLGTVSSATVAGIRTNAAFTGLKAAIANIQKPTAAAEKEAARLGVTFDATALRSKGLIGLFEEITSAANFNSDSFIKLFGSVEALNFANAALSGEGLTRTRDILGDISDEVGRATTFQNALTESQKTLSFQFQRFLGVLDSLAVGIGQRLAPAFGALLGFLSTLFERFRPQILGFFDLVGEQFTRLSDFLIENQQKIGDALGEFFTDLGTGISAISVFIDAAFALISPIFESLFEAFDLFAEKLFGISGAAFAAFLAFFQLTGGLRLIVAIAQLFLAGITLIATFFVRALIPAILAILNPFKLFALAVGAVRFAVILFSRALLAIPLIGILAGLAFLIDATIGWEKALELVGKAVTAVVGFFVKLLAGATVVILKIIEFFALLVAKIVGFFNPELGQKLTDNILQAFSDLKNKIIGFFVEAFDFITNIFSKFTGFFKKTNEQVGEIVKTAEDLAKIKPKSGSILDPETQRRLTINGVTVLGSGTLNLAQGGHVSGAGTSTSDSILARLSDGEFVMRAKAVRRWGSNFLSMLNAGHLPQFATGGLVDALSSAEASRGGLTPIVSGISGGGPAKTQRALNLILPGGQVIKTHTDETTAKRLERDLRRSSMSKPAELPVWYT